MRTYRACASILTAPPGLARGARPAVAKPSAAGAQEVAGNQCVAMWGRTEAGFATDPIMVAQSLIFVVTRMQIQMDRYPKWLAASTAMSAGLSATSHQHDTCALQHVALLTGASSASAERLTNRAGCYDRQLLRPDDVLEWLSALCILLVATEPHSMP